MEKEHYGRLYELEENYWWFVGRRYLLFNFIDKYFKKHKNKKLKILDVGCGTGKNIEKLKKYGEIYGIDSSKEALKFCKKRNIKNVKLGSVENLPYPNNNFDFAICLDVLYHKGVKNDRRALKEINRVLSQNGYLFITDAAMKFLFSKHDLVHHTKRRYTKKELKNKLNKSGFTIKKITYINTTLFPFILLARKFGGLINSEPDSDIKPLNKYVNLLLKHIYKVEIFLVNLLNYPFGVSIFVVAKKRIK